MFQIGDMVCVCGTTSSLSVFKNCFHYPCTSFFEVDFVIKISVRLGGTKPARLRVVHADLNMSGLKDSP